jgi:hypothetical protein
MHCPACGIETREDAQFCGGCGTSLGVPAAEPSNSMLARMLGAARLNVHTFEEVEADTKATKQAMTVVAVVALATGVGAIGTTGLVGMLSGLGIALVGWVIWAWIIYLVGTKLLHTQSTHATWGQLARALGFAQSPGVLKVLSILPGIGGLIFVMVSIWQMVAMVIAVRQALDFTSTWRAVGVVVVAFLPYLIFMMIILSLLT